MLPKLDPVLCAIDLSPASEQVLAHGVALGRAMQAAVHVLHVEEPPNAFGRAEVAHVLGPEGMRRHEAAVTEGLRKQLEERLRAFISDHLQEETTIDAAFQSWQVARGRPVRVIVETAQALGARLVVAGLQGHGTLHDLMVGSVAHQLVGQTQTGLVLVPLRPAGG